jgi:hypothetical protein
LGGRGIRDQKRDERKAGAVRPAVQHLLMGDIMLLLDCILLFVPGSI